MKTKQFTHLLLVCCMSCFVSNACRADQADDEAAIRKSDEAYIAAYNKQDAKALAAMWSPEAVYVDPETGEKAVGCRDRKGVCRNVQSCEGRQTGNRR